MGAGQEEHTEAMPVDGGSLLRAEGVSLVVDGAAGPRPLAEDLSFDLTPGTILPLTGPSGAGKSTLLRALVRLYPLAGGRVLLEGALIESLPPPNLRARMVYLPQSPFFASGSVRDNLLIPFRFKAVRRPPPERETLARGLEELGLRGDMLDEEVSHLSGGEAQRIALLRSLLIEPGVLLLDEPTANLDEASAEAILGKIERWVAEKDRAVLIAAHDRRVVKRLGGEPLRLVPPGETMQPDDASNGEAAASGHSGEGRRR